MNTNADDENAKVVGPEHSRELFSAGSCAADSLVSPSFSATEQQEKYDHKKHEWPNIHETFAGFSA